MSKTDLETANCANLFGVLAQAVNLLYAPPSSLAPYTFAQKTMAGIQWRGTTIGLAVDYRPFYITTLCSDGQVVNTRVHTRMLLFSIFSMPTSMDGDAVLLEGEPSA